jgi:hypothetical protein
MRELAEELLTPPDRATKSVTCELFPPKIFPRRLGPTLSMLLVALPPLNKELTLSTTDVKLPSRIKLVNPVAPSGVATMFVSPEKMLGTAPVSVCRVDDSDSPTNELALRTASGVR